LVDAEHRVVVGRADQEVTVRNRTNVAAYEEAPSGVAGEQYASPP